MLVGNLLSLAKGLGWHVENPIIANVQHLLRERKITYKNTPLIAFDVTFSTNVFLPDYIGLGKSSAMGYGVVRRNSSLNPSERGISNTLKNEKI
jgi:hypothetical protein